MGLAGEEDDTLTINGVKVESYHTVQKLTLSPTRDTVTIVVTAPNGAQATYIIQLGSTVQPGGGGGGSTTSSYPIVLPEQVEHGTVSASPSRASRGKTVTLTVTPEEGYELARLTVTDARGNSISLTEAGDDRYTFRPRRV